MGGMCALQGLLCLTNASQQQSFWVLIQIEPKLIAFRGSSLTYNIFRVSLSFCVVTTAYSSDWCPTDIIAWLNIYCMDISEAMPIHTSSGSDHKLDLGAYVWNLPWNDAEMKRESSTLHFPAVVAVSAPGSFIAFYLLNQNKIPSISSNPPIRLASLAALISQISARFSKWTQWTQFENRIQSEN